MSERRVVREHLPAQAAAHSPREARHEHRLRGLLLIARRAKEDRDRHA